MKEQLPAFVLAELFKDNLVYTGEKLNKIIVTEELPKTESKQVVSAPAKKYLGNYERKIIVLVNDKNTTYLSDANLEFLSGILNACKLNLAHIALMNFDKNAVDFLQLKKEFKPECLLLFGVTVLQIQLPFDMPHYQLQDYNNCKIIAAPSLEHLNQKTAEAKSEKIKLWKSLQKMFGLEK